LGHDPEEARDLTQEFFARLLEKNYLQGAAREKGKFRSYLLMMLKRFLADQWDRARRQKRGGGMEMLSLDAQDTEYRGAPEPASEMTPDRLYERTWAISLLEQVGKRLEQECVESGKAKVYQELAPFLLGEGEETYAAVANKLQMSESNVKVTVHRLRQRSRELLRAEIAQTASTPEEIEEEIRDLFAALR
jgi:RNA polymerase sigma-70 factor (ECF subfamily)